MFSKDSQSDSLDVDSIRHPTHPPRNDRRHEFRCPDHHRCVERQLKRVRVLGRRVEFEEGIDGRVGRKGENDEPTEEADHRHILGNRACIEICHENMSREG